ncbi:mitofilin family membrane protein [Pseudomonas sp. R2.Fl]|nr:mitofilin family membrane protein [Pseudomonas sp. R2.Fl]
MATGRPPRRQKAPSEPVTIDLQAERSEAVARDEGLKPDELHADDDIEAAPEGPPVEAASQDDESKPAEVASDGAGADTPDGTATGASPAEPPPRQPPAPRGPSTSSMIAAGIFGGLIALAGAGSMQYAGILPSTGSTADTAEATDLTARLTAIEDRIATLADAPPAQPADETLAPRLAALETSLEELKAQATSTASESVVAGLRGELAAVAENVGQLKAAIEANAQSVADTDARLAAAEKKIDEPRSDVEMARAIAATALKAAIDRGGPFLAELDTLAGIAPDDPSIAGLKPHAATGVLSRVELVRRFPDVANAILAAVHQPDESEGLGSRLLSSAFSVIKVRPVGNVEGDTPEAIVARMEDKLGNGDLKGALIEWDSLPEAGKAVSGAYAELLRNRLEAETLAASAMNAAVERNG